ncbi:MULTISPECIES: hypothetical protein [Bacteroidaceae]|uniref:Uncharacterized protein n=1 Tax=Phocaeicola intestinalis TaxID=2762212 RepID=A0ABR8YAV3_9BACT|nr:MULTISPECIES: hypothetical protein [Bacteroidaceae]MBD8041297.1 hypothetical protein [Phocaeicola intestinalis]MBM6719605.1 hypothetical protein [Bacteroides gallinaceum]MBM6946283.1 hypothetical protein [Bacteroides gallinaceum]
MSRATSANGVWVLPHDFTRYEDIEDARTKNYLLFKANDGAKHALSLTATLGNTTIKTAYDLGASLKKIGKVEVYPNNLTNCAVNKEYVPTYSTSSVDANAVYDYWLTFEQSADNLKAVQLYGAEIVNDGHSFRYTRDTGVNNSVKLVYNYILMDGTVVEGDKAPIFTALMREEMATEHTVTLERLNVPMDAKYIDGKDNKELTWIDNWIWSNNGEKVFALNTEAYSLTELLNGMSDVEKAVWNSAIANNSVKLTVIGGEGDNNQDNDNDDMGHNVRYSVDTKNNTITFQFCVSYGYPYNFSLNNAYQLTLTVNDQDTQTPVASIVLPFEFTQPTLDITRENGEKAIWTSDTELRLYGDKVGNYMYAPLFEAFTTAYEKEYSKFIPNAEYYVLKGNPKYNIYDGKIMDYTYDKLNAPLTEIAYSSKAEEWETYIHKGDVNSSEIEIFAEYNFYGVYPATEEQVKDFTLVFASLLGDAKEVKTKASEYISNNVTREVILKDTDFTLTDALGNPFYLFDGITADGNIDPRDEMNQRQGFEEDTEGFARNFVLANANITAVDKNGKTIFDKAKGSIIVGTAGTAVVDPDGSITITQGYAGFYENLYTKTNGWAVSGPYEDKVVVVNLPAKQANKKEGLPAVPGGIMIQLPNNIGTTEPITLKFELVDVFGVTKTLSVTVKAAK